MVLRRKSAAMLAQDLGFRSMAAEDLGFTSIRDTGHSNATCVKGKRAMRSGGMGVPSRHIGKDNPTRRFLSSKEALASEELFPGIVNEITWDLIIPKLSWRALPVLSIVSRAWKEAIRTNQAYEERVRANSRETLIIHYHYHNDREDDRDAVALYSLSESCCYELPPIPYLPRALQYFWNCIAVCGKIYILGGMEVPTRERVLEGGRVVREPQYMNNYDASRGVFVLDLGRGSWNWERCASMLDARHSFGCGVIDEKIYVFGNKTVVPDSTPPGTPGGTPLLRSEVYDTQENSWSPIMPMKRLVATTGVAIAAPVGKELFLYNSRESGRESTLGVYNPAKDEWRLVQHFWGRPFPSLVFVTTGNFYSVSSSGIDIYDVERNSWINRHTHSFAELGPDDSAEIQPLDMVAVNDELFLAAYWKIGRNQYFHQSFHCKGFDREKKELVWQKTNCSLRRTHRVQSTVQL